MEAVAQLAIFNALLSRAGHCTIENIVDLLFGGRETLKAKIIEIGLNEMSLTDEHICEMVKKCAATFVPAEYKMGVFPSRGKEPRNIYMYLNLNTDS